MKIPNSLPAIRQAINNEEISCTILVEHYLTKISENQKLNAFLEVYAEEALQRARLLDLKKPSDQGKLYGAVIGLKDNICYKGHKISAASKILEGFTSLYSATAVERMLDEDAIIIGRLNCDEFAMGTSTENSAFGPVLNAADPTRVPGGSSGGSAVAVQAGMCLAALGSDTGGSIRQPASFCGIVGMKPTYGRISRHGLIAYASSFDQIGVLTNNVEDAAILLEVMAGEDEFDSTASTVAPQKYSSCSEENKNYKVAYLNQAIELNGLDSEIKNATISFLENLKKGNYKVDPIEFPYINYLVPTYYVLTTAEASSNLARFDGVHYGYRSPNATDMDSTYKKSRTEGFGKEVKRRIMLGTFVLSSGYYDSYYAKAQKVRRIIADKTAEILNEYDFIVLPTTPTAAFKLGEKIKDPVQMYLADIFTVQANISGVPAISLPLGTHSNGMPFGIQIMSNKFEEGKLLSFAQSIMSKFEINNN